jgi:hypothetical protein
MLGRKEETAMNRRAILIGGIAASLVIGMWEMVVEALLPDGAGFFGPLVAIGATIIRDLQGSANPIPFDLPALVLGAAGHMMNSVVLAAVFGLFALRLAAGIVGLAVTGMVYGAVVWAVMWFVVLPIVDPLMLNLNGFVFLLGHLMWGAVLGLLWARFGAEPRQTAHAPGAG